MTLTLEKLMEVKKRFDNALVEEPKDIYIFLHGRDFKFLKMPKSEQLEDDISYICNTNGWKYEEDKGRL